MNNPVNYTPAQYLDALDVWYARGNISSDKMAIATAIRSNLTRKTTAVREFSLCVFGKKEYLSLDVLPNSKEILTHNMKDRMTKCLMRGDVNSKDFALYVRVDAMTYEVFYCYELMPGIDLYYLYCAKYNAKVQDRIISLLSDPEFQGHIAPEFKLRRENFHNLMLYGSLVSKWNLGQLNGTNVEKIRKVIDEALKNSGISNPLLKLMAEYAIQFPSTITDLKYLVS